MILKEIEVDRLGKLYGDRKVVNDLSFTIKSGAIHGILGPNGAGKTTTLRMMSGLIQPTSGTISMLGWNPQQQHPDFKNILGILPEEPPLYQDMTVIHYLRWIYAIHHCQQPDRDKYLEKILEQVKLQDVSLRLIQNLSKGYKQRVALAGILIFDPQILILDEPTNGLDPLSVLEFRELIKGFKGKKTILISSHILSEVEAICDSVSIIHHGDLKAHGQMEEVKSLFLGAHHILVELAKESAEEFKKFKTLLPLQVIDKKNNGDVVKLKFKTLDGNDHRPALIAELVKADLKVLKIDMEKLLLEEVFREITMKSEV